MPHPVSRGVRCAYLLPKYLAVAIAALCNGSSHAVDAGAVRAWGNNNYGSRDWLPASLGPCSALAVGDQFGVAIKENGLVAAWGSIPVVPSDLGQCQRIAAGRLHYLALRLDGQVRAFGTSDYGATTVPAAVTTAIDVAAGELFSTAIRSDGSLVGWGKPDWGMTAVPTGTFKRVTSGRNHSLAIEASGTVRAWGINGWNQCDVPANLGPCTEVAAGWYHSLALTSGGQVVAWGNNYSIGLLNVPSDLGPCIGIAANELGSIAIQASGGTIRGWGSNGWGQLSAPSDLGAVSQISMGRFDAFAIKAPPASIVGVLPISGPMSGGTPVAISGSWFREGASVLIGNVPATDVVVVSPTRITAVTPPGMPGMATVTVAMVGNTASAEAFYYRPECGSDLDQDGEVTAADIAIVLLDFGPCYQTPLAAPEPEVPPMLEAQPLPDAPRQR